LTPKISTTVLLLTLAVATRTVAQETGLSQTPADSPIPSVAATARGGSIEIDGQVIEDAWLGASPARHFVQREPVEGAAAEESTTVYVLFDDQALYIGAVMRERNPDAIGDQLLRRDERGQYDFFEVLLDPNSDRRTGYRFRVSAAGVQGDAYLYDDVRDDEAWDAVWKSAVHRDSTGWGVEMRIPLSQIQYRPSENRQTWGANFARRRLAWNELTQFALESRERHGRVSAFGRLTGLELPGGTRRIELHPYVLTSARTAPATAGDPFFDGTEFRNQVGLDLRYGLGQYTLDVTVNPDFGQVEVDPAVINLTAFETFFPEKRPFFVEDAQLFDYPRLRLFNSRRIGREPRGSAPDDAEFADIPEQTSILAAVKFTGRTPGGLTIGALAALTDEESGRAFTPGANEPVQFVAEPRSQQGAVRVRQDFRDGATQVGVIATGLHHNLPADSSLDLLTTTALSGGFDFEHNWGGARSRDWVLWGFFAQSFIHGSPEALLRVQQASNHYFQRPDATRFTLDSAQTSLSGRNWRLQFERRSAKHWTGAVWLAEVSSGFEVNDLGFWTQGERLDAGARISYQEIQPGRLLRSYRFSAFTFHNWTHEALDNVGSWSSWQRAHKRGSFSGRAFFEFRNYWVVDVDLRYQPTMMSDVATRGGPLMVDPAKFSIELRSHTDRRRAVVLEPSFEYEEVFRGGYEWQAELGVTLRPFPAFQLDVEPSFASERNPAQYVATTDDLGYAPTFGSRYLFADLDRRTFSLETRINTTFSPTFSLQLYAQPLISSGHYLTYKQLARSETFDFESFEEGNAVETAEDVFSCAGGRTCVADDTRYVDFEGDGTTDFSFSDRDFNIRSFRMTGVLRWEFRPGSTIFVVWQQDRRERADIGSFDFFRDFGKIWSAETENQFIVKMTYWFGL
jgi:hypothetical protein